LTNLQSESKRLVTERDDRRGELSRLIASLAFDMEVGAAGE
jgi:hypothetical protein